MYLVFFNRFPLFSWIDYALSFLESVFSIHWTDSLTSHVGSWDSLNPFEISLTSFNTNPCSLTQSLTSLENWSRTRTSPSTPCTVLVHLVRLGNTVGNTTWSNTRAAERKDSKESGFIHSTIALTNSEWHMTAERSCCHLTASLQTRRLSHWEAFPIKTPSRINPIDHSFNPPISFLLPLFSI